MKRLGRVGLIVSLTCGALLSIVQGHQELDGRIAELTAQIERQPEDAGLYLERGELHRVHGEWKSAFADYQRASELDDELLLVKFYVGRMKLEAGDPAEALAPLDQYLEAVPGNAEALTWRGLARARLGEHLEAAADFSAALENPPAGRRPPPHLYLERARALVAAGEGHFEEALHGLEQGLERLGQPVTLELEALDLEESLGRIEAAAGRLDRLARETRRPEPWLVRKAALFERAGRQKEARDTYLAARRGLAALPDHQRSRGGLARLGEEVEAALARLPAAPDIQDPEVTGG